MIFPLQNKILAALFLFAFSLTVQTALAQAPEKMSYQAIIRDASGSLLKSAPVGFQFSIVQGAATGTAVYVEIQTVTTNTNGLATTSIGSGTVVSGSIADIDWQDGPYFVKTEIDPLGGTSYTINSTTQLLSVPYALFSKVSERSLNDTILYAKTSGTTLKDTVHYAELSGTTVKDTVTYARYSGITASNGDTLIGEQIQLGGTLNRATEIHTDAASTLAITGLQTGDVADSVLTMAPETGVIRKQLLQRFSWATKGNAGINADSNFIGTTDNTNLVFRRNNLKAGVISDSNTAFGVAAMKSNAGGFSNVALGNNVLSENTTGYHNTAVGFNALTNNTSGYSNTAVGYNALRQNKSGMWNTAVGWMSLDSNTGSGNTAYGFYALKANSTGASNVALGYDALQNNRNGSNNTAVGPFALDHNTTGSFNIALGAEAMFNNYKGSTNIAIGFRSLYTNDSGTNNVSIGNNAMGLSFKGTDNIAIGSGALVNNKGNRNIALGEGALSGNDNGAKNIAIGISSLKNNTSGGSNIAIGEQALTLNTTGDQNISIGVGALQRNGSGGSNIAMGYQALQYSLSGSGNCAYGSGSLIYGETGSNNTAYGHMSLFNSNFGNYNTGIGSGADFNGGTAGLSNTICLGYNSGGISKVSNRTEIGNTSMSWIGGQVGWSTYSDRRIKKDIRENVPGLEFIKKLKPVTYHIDAHKQYQLLAANGKADTAQWKEKYAIEDIVQTGFVAQDVAEAAKAVHYDFSGVQVPANESELLSVRYADFVVPLVKAMQEQQALIEKLEQRIAELEKK